VPVRQFELSVFARTTDLWQLRIVDPAGETSTHDFDPAAIGRLGREIAAAAGGTPPPLAAQDTRDFAHLRPRPSLLGAQGDAAWLAAVGQRLYTWLDTTTGGWLGRIWDRTPGLALYIEGTAPLRDLPWEALHNGKDFLCAHPTHPFAPIRRIGDAAQAVITQNRPLQVLFMACAPDDVFPVIDFEREEDLVLAATRSQPIDLRVEDSGSVTEMENVVTSFEPGYFDVFHLSGHAGIEIGGRSVFIMEDDCGRSHRAIARDIGRAFSGRWPRLVFLSGCATGQTVSTGLPSMSEALVSDGASAVLGWALAVRDATASSAAAELYRRLAIGSPIDEGVAFTRQALLANSQVGWNLLRLYVDRTPAAALVTPLRTAGRKHRKIRPLDSDFLDAERRVQVCPRDRFIGRRRILQRCLKVLRANTQEKAYAAGLLLHGMRGLGKSSLAARLCERLQDDMERLVWVGRVDEVALLETLRRRFSATRGAAMVSTRAGSMAATIDALVKERFEEFPMLFVFDGFEANLKAEPDGTFTVEPAAREVLEMLLSALHYSGSKCRVIVTSRYRFALSGPARLHSEALESMRGVELIKMQSRLPWLGSPAAAGAEIRRKSVSLSGGVPGLLETLEGLAGSAGEPEQTAAACAAIGSFRRDLAELLARQPPEDRALIALLSTFDWPVTETDLLHLADIGAPADLLGPAIDAGLVEEACGSPDKRRVLHVPPVLRPLVAGELADPRRSDRWAQAAERAQALGKAGGWAESPARKDIDPLVAACSLWAAAGRIDAAARLLVEEVGPYLATFGDLDRLLELHLPLQGRIQEPVLATGSLIDIATVRQRLGDIAGASTGYRAACMSARQAGDARHQALALNNLGYSCFEEGRVTEALAALADAISLARQNQQLGVEWMARLTSGQCVEARGDVPAARQMYAALLAECASRDQTYDTLCHLCLGNCAAALGEPLGAMQVFDAVLGAVQGRDLYTWSTTLQSRAESLIDLGRLGEALESAETGFEIGAQVASPRHKAENLLSLARSNLLSEAYSAAAGSAQEAAAFGIPRLCHCAQVLLGLAHWRRRDDAPAAHAFRAAIQAADRLLDRDDQDLSALESRSIAQAGLGAADASGGATDAPQTANAPAVAAIHQRFGLSGRARRFAALAWLLRR
jgi:tetratricopeptide (TPR) repeat protein